MAMTEISLRQPLRYTIDLGAGLVQQPMRSQLMKGDKKANRVIVHLTDGGKDVTLSGVTVTGSFIRPPDAAEIPLTGETSGSEAIVTLDDACYSTEGYCEISVKLTVGETSRTILTLTGYVLSKGSGAYVDVSGVIPNIDDVIAQYAEMKRVTQETQAAGTAAGNAAGAANTAAGAANAQAQAAQQAAQAANTAAAKIDGMTVSAEKADAAGATISQKDGAYHIKFQLPKGDTGATPDITFEVETGPAGSDVQLEQSGTPEAPVVKLTIPRGDTGAVEGVDYYEGNPKALGEASPGTANGVARGDHVHPKPTPEELGAATIDDITPGAKTTYSSEKIEGELSSLSEQIKNVGTLNLLRNSNFKQWVAQAGIMGMHGTKQYAGDAWICTNGNVSGELNSDGEGYTDITLSSGGRIDQVVAGIDQYYGEMMTIALWLDDGTMAVRSGIVSSPVSNYQTPISANINGVYIHLQATAGSQRRYMFLIDNQKNSSVKIKAASIIPGAYSPETMLYVPKGYAVELAECQRYYYKIPTDNARMAYVGYTAGSDIARITIPTPVPMQKVPSLAFQDGSVGMNLFTPSGSVGVKTAQVTHSQSCATAIEVTTTSPVTEWVMCAARFNVNAALEADL